MRPSDMTAGDCTRKNRNIARQGGVSQITGRYRPGAGRVENTRRQMVRADLTAGDVPRLNGPAAKMEVGDASTGIVTGINGVIADVAGNNLPGPYNEGIQHA